MKKICVTLLALLLMPCSYAQADGGCEKVVPVTKDEKAFMTTKAGQVKKAMPAAPSGWAMDPNTPFSLADSYPDDNDCIGKKRPLTFGVDLSYSKNITSMNVLEDCNKKMEKAMARGDYDWAQNEYQKCASGSGLNNVHITVTANGSMHDTEKKINEMYINKLKPLKVKGAAYAFRDDAQNYSYVLLGDWQKVDYGGNEVLVSNPNLEQAKVIQTLGIRVEADEKTADSFIRKIDLKSLRALVK